MIKTCTDIFPFSFLLLLYIFISTYNYSQSLPTHPTESEFHLYLQSFTFLSYLVLLVFQVITVDFYYPQWVSIKYSRYQLERTRLRTSIYNINEIRLRVEMCLKKAALQFREYYYVATSSKLCLPQVAKIILTIILNINRCRSIHRF